MSVRILNTWGGYTAKDATALPGDVMQEKVFYNNDGRQVGTGKMLKKIVMPKRSGTHTGSTIWKGFRYTSDDGYRFDGGVITFNDNSLDGHYNSIDGVRHIIGVEIDGIYTMCPSIIGEYTVYAYNVPGVSGRIIPWFYHYGSSIYYAYALNDREIPSNVRNRQIIIHYMDE